MKRLFGILFLIVMLLCKCKPSIVHRDGLLVENCSENGSVVDAYFYSNNYAGIYVKQDTNSDIEVVGTYYNGKRNGIWDTMCIDGVQSQCYFQDDLPLISYKAKYHFNYYKFSDYDFTVLIPRSWMLVDSISSSGYLSAIATSFPNGNPPRFLIYRITNIGNEVSNIIDQKYEPSALKMPSIFNYRRTSSNSYCLSHIQDGDTLSYNAKVIKTKNGVFHFSCQCKSDIYNDYYQYVFITIINSFNSISGVRQ